MSDSVPTILVIEDDAIIAADVCRCLSCEGYTVVGPAADCVGALSLAAKTEIDLVLIDITLNGALDGITAARELCNGRRRIVFVTADLARAATEALELADGFLSKPFVRKDLLRLVAALGLPAAEARLPAGQPGRTVQTHPRLEEPLPCRLQSASGS